MQKISQELQSKSEESKRKKCSVLITTREGFEGNAKLTKLMDGIYKAKLTYNQMQEIAKDNDVVAIETDGILDVF